MSSSRVSIFYVGVDHSLVLLTTAIFTVVLNFMTLNSQSNSLPVLKAKYELNVAQNTTQHTI